ncbi:MAG: hypothetical protein JWQ90_4831 [Hydrocarboniphaga sp.]|uniref:RDD family protein n=1 Tax=Hydrocarboniphaga sp. TaxID=2033016 RepID=UPI00262C27C9|nr:RDD family protein [Hydrocarboniphaga sp.]MDB5972381.1 hypothetical protein [Hydrocarboniphaga sp.]
MSRDPETRPKDVDKEPRWERAPSENEAFAAPAHDPRDIITPHAFRVSPSLLGLPLATPNRRAIAIGIDAVLVLLLTKTGGVMLAAVLAVFAYSWLKNRYRPSSRIARGLGLPARILVAMLIFAVAVSLLQPVWDRYVGDDDEDASAPKKDQLISGADSMIFGAMLIALKACDDAKCRTDAVEGMAAALAEVKGKPEPKLAKINGLIDETISDEAERAQLKASAAAKLEQSTQEIAHTKTRGKKATAADADDDAGPKTEKAERQPEYSLLKQLYGMLDDLGLSIGWAAAYFTLFTTLWAGQTPGKRLMKIRVVHLGGKPLSYWMSFGRYGGYAAGFSTGLLGFLQIYWDPNRQAVQDQLSFTAVIRDVDLSHLKIEP